jgi:LAS superfamily LD-carboxypeptidase LdcB
MEKLMSALSDMRHAAVQAREEIAKIEGFRPKKAQKKLYDIMLFSEYIAKRLEGFFQELHDEGKAELHFEFSKRLDPWTIFGEDEEPKKTKRKKPAKTN